MGSQQTYLAIKQYIVKHRLRPGEQVHPATLADRLGVSVTPVREALWRLSSERLISSVPNKGFFAKPLCSKDLRDHYDHARVIISYLTKLPSSSALAERLASASSPWTAAAARAAVASGPETGAAYVEELYITVAQASNNSVVVRSIEHFIAHTHCLRLIHFESEPNRRRVGDLIDALIAPLYERDICVLATLLEELLRDECENLAELVKEALSRAYDVDTSEQDMHTAGA